MLSWLKRIFAKQPPRPTVLAMFRKWKREHPAATRCRMRQDIYETLCDELESRMRLMVIEGSGDRGRRLLEGIAIVPDSSITMPFVSG